jgi:hypothetical protein
LTPKAETRRLLTSQRVVHTPNMTIKDAALLALMGMVCVTALLSWVLIENLLNVARGLIPAMILFPSLIYTFGACSVAVFFFVFHRGQR